MNISDEAVEAAAKEFAAIADPLGGWDNQADAYHRIYRERATRILEAAAPYMLADVWDAGAKAGADYEFRTAEALKNGKLDRLTPTANPYRSQA